MDLDDNILKINKLIMENRDKVNELTFNKVKVGLFAKQLSYIIKYEICLVNLMNNIF